MLKNKKGDLSVGLIIAIAVGLVVAGMGIYLAVKYGGKAADASNFGCSESDPVPGECLCKLRYDVGAEVSCKDYDSVPMDKLDVCPPDSPYTGCSDEAAMVKLLEKSKTDYKQLKKSEKKTKRKSYFGTCCRGE